MYLEVESMVFEGAVRNGFHRNETDDAAHWQPDVYPKSGRGGREPSNSSIKYRVSRKPLIGDM